MGLLIRRVNYVVFHNKDNEYLVGLSNFLTAKSKCVLTDVSFLHCVLDFMAFKRTHSKSEWFYQCWGSMTFLCGSGCGSGSRFFHHWRSRRLQKTYFSTNFFCILVFEGTVHFHHFSKIKSQKKSQNSRNQGLSYYVCIMIEASDPLTNGSGSGIRRPKNTWIRNIGFYIRY